MRSSVRWRGVCAVGGIALCVLLTACGSSSKTPPSNGGESVSTESDDSGVKKARAIVAKAMAPQPRIKIPALPERPAQDRSLVVVGCPVPSCQATMRATTKAGRALGWSVSQVVSQFTPEGYVSAWNQALQKRPDNIAYISILPNSIIQRQLQTAADRGINVVGIAGADQPSKLMPAVYAGTPEFVAAGKLLAAFVVADGGGPTHSVFVREPTLPIFGPEVKAYEETLKALCPDCSTDTLDISSANVGKTVPREIVNYAQRHPDVRYLVFPIDDFALGVYPALQAAGLADKVKIVGQTPTGASLASIRAGQELASVGDENGTAGWRAVDGLARLDMGIPLGECCTSPPGWLQLFTKDNAPSESELVNDTPPVPGDPDAFLEAWHVK